MSFWAISIHALREEGDDQIPLEQWYQTNFYPRPPRGGRPAGLGFQQLLRDISIHALREEGDTSTLWSSSCSRYFYPRPPRGGRQDPAGQKGGVLDISIHALREEGDHAGRKDQAAPAHFYPRPPRGGRRYAISHPLLTILFLSTPSARRATMSVDPDRISLTISIHALREEGDKWAA